jgi:hypothetical protein
MQGVYRQELQAAAGDPDQRTAALSIKIDWTPGNM